MSSREKTRLRLASAVGLAALLATAAAQAQSQSPAYWADTWRGWHFYEMPPVEPPPPLAQPRMTPPAPPATVPVPPRPNEVLELEQLQKALEESRTIAIMRPTEANVRRYMELENRVVAQASRFADVAQRVAWSAPELDPTWQGRPVGAKALEVFESEQRSERSRSIAQLGNDHVLLFFYRSDCPYCHAMAPTLQSFQAQYGIRVVAIGVDKGPIPGFPDARADNGIATTLRVTRVPAVFLAQPFTGLITPIGQGVLSQSQLVERITTLAANPSDPVDGAPSFSLRSSP